MTTHAAPPAASPPAASPTASAALSPVGAPAASRVPSPASAPAGVEAVTDATFAASVLGSDLPVLVDFTASWCGPCRMIAPVLDEIAAEQAGRLRIVSLDVDANPGTQAAYGVLSMPTLLLFRAGEPVKALVGARPKRRLLQELADQL